MLYHEAIAGGLWGVGGWLRSRCAYAPPRVSHPGSCSGMAALYTSEDDRSRHVLWTTTGPCSLQLAHHPGCAGAGAGSALTWPHWAAALARRPCLSCIVSRQP